MRLGPVAAVLTLACVTACTGAGPGSSVPSGSATGATSAAPPVRSAAPTSSPRRASVGTPEVIATRLAVPWGVAFLANGDALVSERDSHRVVRVTPHGGVTPVGTVPGVRPDAGEGGLLGLALSPDFATDHLVY
ncbi:MAG: PQQ-dependent sugar dehydrogenase, partial [Acidothermales bacterium]|nr:PQQ-dependent sugar dehydrogenase [Acidothermales bacterium]